MPERKLIIHSDIAEKMLQEKKPGDRYYVPLLEHVSVIKNVRQEQGTVELAQDDSPRRAGEYFKEEDEVIIYGLWRDSCVKAAKESLEDNGVVFKEGDEQYSILPER